jgi:integrase
LRDAQGVFGPKTAKSCGTFAGLSCALLCSTIATAVQPTGFGSIRRQQNQKVATRPHFAATIGPAAVDELLRAINGYVGQTTTVAALKLAPYVFVRPGELRAAEWSEFDFNNAEWRIPAARIKMGEQHVVPLAHQTAAILRGLQPLTGLGRYVFPSLLSDDRPMSEEPWIAS